MVLKLTHKIKSIVLISFFFIFQNVCAQNDANTYVFKHFKVEDGLSQSWVQCIQQDYLGFMWFGTGDGLNRFDGYAFKVYKHNPKSLRSLKNNSVNKIFEDSNRNLWIGTATGLCLFNRSTESFSYQSDWPDLYVSDIIQQGENLLIATDRGLFKLDIRNKNISQISINGVAVLAGKNLNCIEKDTQNNLWIGSKDGLYYLKSNESDFRQIIPEQNKKQIVNPFISSIYTDSKGTVWIGTEKNGLFFISESRIISGQTEPVSYTGNSTATTIFSRGMIRSIMEDQQNVLWVGIENYGLSLIDDITKSNNHLITPIRHDPKNEKGLSSNSIYSIFTDNQGNIWLGTYGGGINFFNNAGINFINFKNIPDKKNSLINNNVNVFFEFNNEIWIGTEGGLSVFEPISRNFANFSHVTGKQVSTESEAIWAITADKNEKIWLGTWANGLSLADPYRKNFSAIDISAAINPNIFSIYQDSENIIWIATMGGGLISYDPSNKTYSRYQTDENNPYSISDNWVQFIYENSRNELWISTTRAVDLFDRKHKRFIHFSSDISDTTSISGRGAYVIFEDSKKNMWFGTEAGLNYFIRSDSTFAYYQEDDGLPNNSVKGILEDNHGNLWISTNKGISKMIDAISLPKNPEFRNFDIADGLQGNEFNRKAAFKSKTGFMFFGGTNGFNMFHPDSIQENKLLPQVVFTNLLVSNKPVEIGVPGSPITEHISVAKKITLKYNQSVFSIEFAALNYLNSEKNQYQYMLEGFDEEWNKVRTQRFATYTNLNPGKYIFKVIASNNDDNWNLEGKQIELVILPPWYRTNLAYLIYLLFIGFLVYTFRRLTLTRAKLKHEIVLKQIEKDKLDEVHQVKTRFFTNISHEFRTPLTLIIGPIEKMLASNSFTPELNRQFQLILKNSLRMLRLINQFLDLSKIEAGYLKMAVHEGNMSRYIQTISDIFAYQAKEKKINYTYETNFDSLIAWFDSDKIEKILYNLLSNAIKYTPEGNSVQLKVKFNQSSASSSDFPGYVEFWVSDTGIGINPEDREKVFNRFFQSGNATNQEYAGTGIGLSLVQGLVEKYSGKIDMKSEPDKGSEFYVRLPIARHLFNEEFIVTKSEEEYLSKLENYKEIQQLPQSKVSDCSDSFDKSKPVLLIVEDNVDLLNYIAEHFRKSYNILEAVNGKEGIHVAIARNPDIIITDIMMPVADGIELCRTLKNNLQTSHIPILILTAKASDTDHVEGLKTGADGFLAKPFNVEVLEARVNNLLDSRAKLRQLFSQKINLEPKDITITSVDATFLKKAIDLVEKYISDADFSTDQMAREIGMSRASLHRKLIALTDQPPSAFIRNLRMKRAARLLVEGQKTVSEVLYEVGIKSRSYFTKTFKETFGMSPTEYVENAKNKSQE